MGLGDRDYSRLRDEPEFGSQGGNPLHWLWILPLTGAVLLVTLGPPSWLPPGMALYVEQIRARVGLGHVDRGASDSLSTPAPLVVRRCAVNGVVVDVLNADCPPSVAPQPTRMPSNIAVPMATVPSNPFLKPGTIYRCKSYGGGVFWAQAHCSQHNAVIERIASVPIGLPFQQQVDIADREAQAVESSLRNEQREGERAALCAGLRNEREAIWKRSGSGSGYTPMPELDADQRRWRQVSALMASNGCGG